MSRTALRALALAQLMEAISRLILSAANCSTEQIERMTEDVCRCAYHFEEHGAHDERFSDDDNRIINDKD